MIDVPEPLQRWRLLLGEPAQASLGELSPDLMRADAALEWVYGRDPSRLERGERTGGRGAAELTVPEWIAEVHELFPREVIERVESDAVEQFGITEIVTRLDVLERIEPSESLLRSVLQSKHLMNPDVLAAARRVVARVIEKIMAELHGEIRQAFAGTLDPRRRSPFAVARNFDFDGTIAANLHRWNPERGKLYLERPLFLSRTRRNTERWQITLLIDQSGSMLDSVIHSAVMASILSSLPGMETKLAAFADDVVDLTGQLSDPVETLMSVQLSGGTDIGRAVGWAQQQVRRADRSIVVIISDFFEGGSVELLVRRVRDLVGGGTIVLGLAALGRDATPAYDHDTARRLVNVGARVAAMTPLELAGWLAEQVQR